VEKERDVLERVYEPRRLLEAWRQVKNNAGAAGIDRMTVKEFDRRKRELFPEIRRKLIAGIYRFKPARRVLIPKAGSPGKFRKLGIPVVIDRIIAQSIHTVFEEIFDPQFTPHSYGFRQGRSQHQAIRYVREKVVEGYEWCVSVDLKSFFDEIPHELIFKLIRRSIADERLVTLVARALKAGVIVEGRFEETTKGTPQGSPLSPILSNIVLNEMDHELERRGLAYARWADDFVILVKTERSAHRVMERITRYLQESLGLPVNGEKSEVAKMSAVTFLGFRIYRHKIRVSPESLEKFKGQLRELTHRNNPLSMFMAVRKLNSYLRGWVEYFRLQEGRELFRLIDRRIRCRLRVMQLVKWKKPKKLQRIMIQTGFPVWEARRTWVEMDKWRSIYRKEVRMVLCLKWFRQMGLVFLEDFAPAPTG